MRSSDSDITFQTIEEFCNYYGLIIEEDEYVQESIGSKLGTIERRENDNKYIRKNWKGLASNISHKTISRKISDKEYEKLQGEFNTLKSSKIYTIYKNAYESICKFFNLIAPNTTIKNIKFHKEEDSWYVDMAYHYGKKKIMIPNGVQLIHTSKTDNIKELIPNFCSKRKGYYMWPTKRVYFTLGKEIDPGHAGIRNSESTHHYTPKEKIRTAYIDAELPTFSMGAVFVDTKFPIKVEKID